MLSFHGVSSFESNFSILKQWSHILHEDFPFLFLFSYTDLHSRFNALLFSFYSFLFVRSSSVSAEAPLTPKKKPSDTELFDCIFQISSSTVLKIILPTHSDLFSEVSSPVSVLYSSQMLFTINIGVRIFSASLHVSKLFKNPCYSS